MPQHKSAKTRMRRNARREDINTARKSRIRTTIRAVNDAVAKGDAKDAEAQLRKATAEVQRGVTKGVVKKNTAARTVSRLTKKLKKLSA